jgi:hypothetical protein
MDKVEKLSRVLECSNAVEFDGWFWFINSVLTPDDIMEDEEPTVQLFYIDDEFAHFESFLIKDLAERDDLQVYELREVEPENWKEV